MIHKPEKLNRCLPFVIDFVENVGRVLRAAKIIKKGEVVMFDGAFTMGNFNITARWCLNSNFVTYARPHRYSYEASSVFARE